MKTLCLGDNVIDYYQNTGEMFPGGNAVNVAVHLAKLDVDSTYLGNIGDDQMSEVIRKALRKNNVNFNCCETIVNGTTKHCVYDVIDGERTFLRVELGDNWSGPMDLTGEKLDYISSFDIVLSSCNAKMENEMSKVGKLNNVFVYDFGEKSKYRVDEYLKKVCHGLDVAMFSCSDLDEQQAMELAKKVVAKGAKNILLTRGGKGQILYNSKLSIINQPKLIEAVDTMGAGDSFLAAFCKCLLENGYQKGMDIDHKLAELALKEGSEYSLKNCLVKGAF